MPSPEEEAAAAEARAQIRAGVGANLRNLFNVYFRSMISHPVHQQHDGTLTRDVYSHADIAKETDAQKRSALMKLIGKPKVISQEEAAAAHAQRTEEAREALHELFQEAQEAALDALAHHLHPEHHEQIASEVQGPAAAPAKIYHPGP